MLFVLRQTVIRNISTAVYTEKKIKQNYVMHTQWVNECK